jgi:hypothetical protein
MRSVKYAGLMIALLVGATACQKNDDKVTEEATYEQQTSQGEETTKVESEQVGSTLTATSETTVDTPDGTVKSETETVIGTVTVYDAGKKIEVLTGASDNHSFDLNDKDTTVNVDGAVKVGSKVTVTEHKDDAGRKVVDIRVEAM